MSSLNFGELSASHYCDKFGRLEALKEREGGRKRKSEEQKGGDEKGERGGLKVLITSRDFNGDRKSVV